MTRPSFAEPLKLMIARLQANAAITAIVPVDQIRSRLPQWDPDKNDRSLLLPHIKVAWKAGNAWDDKTNQGYQGQFIIQSWFEDHSPGPSLELSNLITTAIHEVPLPMTTGQSLLLLFNNCDTIEEPGGLFQTRLTFNHIATNEDDLS